MIERNPHQKLPIVMLLLDQFIFHHIFGIAGSQGICPAEVRQRLSFFFFEQTVPGLVFVQLRCIVNVLAKLLRNEDDV